MKRNLDKDKLDTYISITHTTIVICWVTLICYWIIKLLGVNWFEIVVHNENFVKFSQYVQTSWLKYLVSFITMFVGNYIPYCAISQRFSFKGKDFVFIFILILSIWAVVNFSKIDFLIMWYGYALSILIGIIYQKGWKKTFGLLSILLELVFSGISLLTRNINLTIIYDELTILILGIDIYIMYFLYYLYMNLIRLKKEMK